MKIIKVIISAFARIASMPGYMFLTASDQALAKSPAGRFGSCWIEIMVLSAIWSLISVGLWHFAVIFSGDRLISSPIPPVIIITPFICWLYRRAIIAFARVCFPRDRDSRSVIIAVIIALLLVFFLNLRGQGVLSEEHSSWHAYWIRDGWQWLRPRSSYRVVLLGPLWGAWAMLITTQFGRVGKNTEPSVHAFVRGCGPVKAAISMVLPLAGSLYYFNHLPWWQVSISASAILSATLGGVVICKISGGLGRKPLLAVNILTQLVFFFAYLTNRIFAGA